MKDKNREKQAQKCHASKLEPRKSKRYRSMDIMS